LEGKVVLSLFNFSQNLKMYVLKYKDDSTIAS
jgi:hypothetical protein